MPNANDLISQDRELARRRGDSLNQQSQDRSGVARNTRAAQMAYSDEVYDPLIGGRGGYNPGEAAAIQGDYTGVAASPDDLQGNYLTGQEQNDIVGTPWDRAAYYDPDDAMAQTGRASDRVRGAVDQYGRNLNEAIGPGLNVDTAYTDSQQGTIGQTGADIRGAVDPTLLRADPNALNAIRMSPEEYQETITGAGNVVGEGYRAASDDVLRRSRAAGVGPLGAAAARERLERSSAVDRGDAMTRAKIAAGAARASRAGTAEDYRMRGEESASDRSGDAALRAGQFEYGSRAGMEDQRLGAARDVSGRKLQATTEAGRAAVGAETDAAAREAAARNFNTTTGTELATGIERDTQQRKAGVAANRQAVNAGNVDTRYAQGMGVRQAQTAGAKTTADARRADAAEGRTYLNTSINRSQADEQADYDRQVNIFNSQGQQQQAATGAQVNQNAQPRWWEKVGGLVVGGATAAATGGLFGGKK